MIQSDADLIAAIRAKAEKATPGPWCWEFTGEKSNEWAVGTATTDGGTPIAGRLTTTDDPECTGHDGVFMEHTVLRHTFIGEGDRVADAQYIAACSPDALLRLCALAARGRDLSEVAIGMYELLDRSTPYHDPEGECREREGGCTFCDVMEKARALTALRGRKDT